MRSARSSTATGIDAFELVGFDACLMGQLEVMSGIAPHAKYAVGSEETEPSLGWSYAGFLTALTENTAMTGRRAGPGHRRQLHRQRHPHHRRPGPRSADGR